MRINLGSIASNIRKKFFDTFTRADSASDVGRSDDGSLWQVVRGTWGITSNKASSSTAPSSYPIIAVDMPKQDVQIDLQTIDNGTGAALWVTDSGNWWGIAVDQETVTTYSTCTAYNCNAYSVVNFNACASYNALTCNAYSVACTPPGYLYYFASCTGNFNASTCASFNTSTCSAYNSTKNCKSYNASTCKSYNVSNCNAYSNVAACNISNFYMYYNCSGGYSSNCKSYVPDQYFVCNAYSSTPYACNPVTTYPIYIRLYQSVANTVSQIATQTLSSMAQSLRITTNSTQVTTKAYSDANQVTQIDSDWVYTATGATVTPKYGLIVTPTNYSQGSSVGDITIS